MPSTTSAATVTAHNTVGPVAEKERIMALDVIRGIALFGILLINIVGFGYPYGVSEFTASPLSLWSWIITSTFFEGTQRSLFSFLFGAGVILLTTRMEERGSGVLVADIYYRRTIWLIIIGMFHAYVLLRGGGDILYRYGVAALFLFPLRKLAPKYLFAIGVVGLLIIAAQNTYEASERVKLHANYVDAQQILASGGELTDPQQEAIDDWDERMERAFPTTKMLQKRIEEHTGNYWEIFLVRAPQTVEEQSKDLYRWDFLDVFAIMVFGMALMKLGVMTLRQPSRVYWLMVIAGYGIGLPVSLWETTLLISNDYDLLSRAATWPSYDLGRVANATGHLGLLLLFCRSGRLKKLQENLAAVGRMALTNYVAQSVICITVFWGVGFRLYGDLERYELYYVVFAIWVFQLITSPIWLRYYKFGPIEWLWRSLTYMKMQPMRRLAQPAAAVA